MHRGYAFEIRARIPFSQGKKLGLENRGNLLEARVEEFKMCKEDRAIPSVQFVQLRKGLEVLSRTLPLTDSMHAKYESS